MERELVRYVGRNVTIIYKDRNNMFTKRRIKILAVDERTVKAFCLERLAPRTFFVASIFAVEPTLNRAVGR